MSARLHSPADPGPAPATPGFAEALRRGLSARPRAVAPQWFYDTEGSALFERICETPEYYPTRTERALLDAVGPEIAGWLGPDVELVEFGAGACEKAGRLLACLERPRRFVPLDISAEHLWAAAARLRRQRPGLEVLPLAADFTAGFALPPPLGRRVGFFPGSSIGNWEPAEAARLLARFGAALGPAAGGLLVGVDLVKDPALLHAAYNDAAGITAAFNRNLLARANRELGAGFDLDAWAHAAFYHPALQRIEMHLVARRADRATIAGVPFVFDEGDSIHTENSYKYTVPGFGALAQLAGFEAAAVWTDAARHFALFWLVPLGPLIPEEHPR